MSKECYLEIGLWPCALPSETIDFALHFPALKSLTVLHPWWSLERGPAGVFKSIPKTLERFVVKVWPDAYEGPDPICYEDAEALYALLPPNLRIANGIQTWLLRWIAGELAIDATVFADGDQHERFRASQVAT
jgi:hypothetical protein